MHDVQTNTFDNQMEEEEEWKRKEGTWNGEPIQQMQYDHNLLFAVLEIEYSALFHIPLSVKIIVISMITNQALMSKSCQQSRRCQMGRFCIQ